MTARDDAGADDFAGATAARRSAALVASTQDAVVIADAGGRILEWNAAAAELFGYSSEEAVGRSLDIIVPEAMRGEHAAGMRRVCAGGAPRILGRPVVVPAQRSDGRPISIEMRASMWRSGERVEFGAIIRDVSERRKAEEELHGLAHFDQLTQLPNRKLFIERLQQCLAHDGEAAPATLLILDLDRFGDINDIHGNRQADRMLVAVGVALKKVVEMSDRGGTMARIGPNQFGVVLPKLQHVVTAAAFADTLCAMVRKLGAARDWPLTASVGTAIAPLHGSSPGELMANADFALRRAKAAGGDRRLLFQIGQSEAARSRRNLELELKRAWAAGEFETFFQPQVSLADGGVVGAEALLRWKHPNHGMVLPGAFIGVLENSRLAEQVGDFVLDQACRHVADWRAATGRPLRVGVNLFERQFVRPDQPRRIERALDQTGLPPDALELEIIETSVTGADESSIRRVKRLRDIGVGIAFDDYGTGYASLGLLKRYPITRLKIDRSFVRDMTTDQGDAAIVELVVSLGRKFGLEVTAEGVETDAQHARLVEIGCPEGQGYLFGRPLSADDFARMLRAPSKTGCTASA